MATTAKIRDYECPICMLLMIEPVTLPCKHELCLKCFTLHIKGAGQCCPFCRTRIATWSKKEMRLNRVVNKDKWDLIQRLFPKQVKCITEGKELVSDEDDEPGSQIISEAGSLGKEFRDDLQKMEAERSRAFQEQEAASLALIQKLFEAESQSINLTAHDTTSTSVAVSNQKVHVPACAEQPARVDEGEAASLQLIESILEEERRILAEQKKQEAKDRIFARQVAAEFNAEVPDLVSNAGIHVAHTADSSASSSLGISSSEEIPNPSFPPSSSSSNETVTFSRTVSPKSKPVTTSTTTATESKPVTTTQLTRWLSKAWSCPDGNKSAASSALQFTFNDSSILSKDITPVLKPAAAAASSTITRPNDAASGSSSLKVRDELNVLMKCSHATASSSAVQVSVSIGGGGSNSVTSAASCGSSSGSFASIVPSFFSFSTTTVPSFTAPTTLSTSSRLNSSSAVNDLSAVGSATDHERNMFLNNTEMASSSVNYGGQRRRSWKRQSVRRKAPGPKAFAPTLAAVSDISESQVEVQPPDKKGRFGLESRSKAVDLPLGIGPVLGMNAFNSDELSAQCQQRLKKTMPTQNEEMRYNLRRKRNS